MEKNKLLKKNHIVNIKIVSLNLFSKKHKCGYKSDINRINVVKKNV